MFRQRIAGDQPVVRSRALVTPGTSKSHGKFAQEATRPAMESEHPSLGFPSILSNAAANL